MDPDFWHAKWQSNQIGFHNDQVHPMLARHFPTLGLAGDARVFLPLCGKTRDIEWLLAQGCRVAGAELSQTAIEQLFDELGRAPEVTDLGPITRYSTERIDIFVGDIFDLDDATLGPIDAVYDRAALVALPANIRVRYAAHMTDITARTRQLLISFEYDASTVSGPPFPVDGTEIAALYPRTEARLIETRRVDGLKGVTPAHELVWHLDRVD